MLLQLHVAAGVIAYSRNINEAKPDCKDVNHDLLAQNGCFLGGGKDQIRQILFLFMTDYVHTCVPSVSRALVYLHSDQPLMQGHKVVYRQRKL